MSLARQNKQRLQAMDLVAFRLLGIKTEPYSAYYARCWCVQQGRQRSRRVCWAGRKTMHPQDLVVACA